MRKLLIFIILFGGIDYACIAQSLDSLLQQLPNAREDTNKVKLYTRISHLYPYINPDEGLKYGNYALELADKLSWSPGIADAYAAIGGNYANKADYANALDYEYKALKIYEQNKNIPKQAVMLQNIAIVYHTSKNQPKSLEYNQKSLELYEKLNDKQGVAAIFSNMANVYYSLGDKEKVLEYNLKALRIYEEANDKRNVARLLGNIANFYAFEGEFSKAMVYYFDALRKETALGNKNGVTRNMGNIGETYLDIARDVTGNIQPDSLIPSGKKANLERVQKFQTA